MSTDLLEPPPRVKSANLSPDALTEVVNGIVVEKPEIGIRSCMIAGEIHWAIRTYLADHRIGTVVVEGMVILDAELNLRRRPDVSFVSADRWPIDKAVPDEGDWDVVPDLAVEVVSPNDTARDVFGKVGEYFAHGVREVWLVLPDQRQVHVYSGLREMRILGEEQSVQTPLLPEFSLPLSNLFGPPVASRPKLG